MGDHTFVSVYLPTKIYMTQIPRALFTCEASGRACDLLQEKNWIFVPLLNELQQLM